MNDRDLVRALRAASDRRCGCCACLAADRIEELRRDLNRANQRIGLFMHHASRKKAKR
jgi:hypothetical protein